MKCARQFACCLAAFFIFFSIAQADDLAMAENPYTSIPERNVFALSPIPTNPPVPDLPPVDPPPKITPNGYMTLFGKLQVLFKVTPKALPGQPAKDDSYVMAEGERRNDIEVVKINNTTGVITFNNHGTIQQLALVDAPKQTSAPAPNSSLSGMNTSGGIPMPTMPSSVSPGLPSGLIGRTAMGRIPPSVGGSSAAGSGMTGGVTPETASPSQPKEQLTPEAQVLLMEAERAKFLQSGDQRRAALLPPTPLTQQNIDSINQTGNQQ